MPKLTMRRLAAAAALVAALAFARVFAQIPAQSGTGSIAGRVLDGATGQPVAGALVYIDAKVSGSSNNGTVREGRNVTSGARGEFTFSDVAAGSHRFQATKTGYRTGYGGGASATQGGQFDPTPLVAGETKTGVTVRMWQSAAIAGHVRSASGTPLVRATVTAFRPRNICGTEQLSPEALTTATDDQGAYRLFDLSPGPYLLAVQGNLMTSVETASRRAQQLGGYPTIYFPNVVDPALGQRFVVAGGDERTDADLRMPDAAAAIRGRVTMPDGQEPAASYRVDLLPAPGGPVVYWPIARVFTGADGRFEFPRTPRGTYLLRSVAFPRAVGPIQQSSGGFTILSADQNIPLPPAPNTPTLWGEALVDLADRDADVSLRLQEGWRIRGRVTFDAKDAPSGPELESIAVLTFRSDGSDPGGTIQPGRVEADGQFTTMALPPGRYAPMVLLSRPSPTPSPRTAALSVQSVNIGGRDATGTAIDVNGSDVRDVTIAYTDRGPVITGTVEGGDDLGTFGGTIYAFPTSDRLWSECGGWTATMLRTTTIIDGRFKTVPLPPGEYFIAAIIGAEDAWKSPAFLRSLVPFAARVKVALGDTPSVQLKAKPRR